MSKRRDQPEWKAPTKPALVRSSIIEQLNAMPDEQKIQGLAMIGCQLETIHRLTGVSMADLQGKHAQLILQSIDAGHVMLRQRQFEIALKGDVQMLKFLGNHVLKQIETLTIKNDTSGQSSEVPMSRSELIDEIKKEAAKAGLVLAPAKAIPAPVVEEVTTPAKKVAAKKAPAKKVAVKKPINTDPIIPMISPAPEATKPRVLNLKVKK